jgi:hypothetical protein
MRYSGRKSCFVDREEGYACGLEEVEHLFRTKPFGRDVQQLQFPGTNLVGNVKPLGMTHRAVHAGGGDAALRQSVDLVFHQRNQR